MWMRLAMEPITTGLIVGFLADKVLGTALEKYTEKAMEGLDKLVGTVKKRFQGNDRALDALTALEEGDKTAKNRVEVYLEDEMKSDPYFAQEIQQIAREISINIDKVDGENWNVFGGEVNYVKDNKSPVIQGGQGHSITFKVDDPS